MKEYNFVVKKRNLQEVDEKRLAQKASYRFEVHSKHFGAFLLIEMHF